MMTTFKWNAEAVIKLALRTKVANTHRADFEGNQVPALWFVKDEGVYLMSNRVYQEPETPLNTKEVLYAENFGSKANWDDVREAAGGDDFCETITVDEILHMCQYAVEMINKGVILPKTYKFIISFSPGGKTMSVGFKMYKK